MSVIIKSKYDLPEIGAMLKFRLHKNGDWIHGSFSQFEPLRFYKGETEFVADSESYPWEEVYEYENYIFKSIDVSTKTTE